ncbi:MAG: tetratricopeptide repeat protein, partial [Bryobacteraceae bacterium]
GSYELERLNGYISLAEAKPKEALEFFGKANELKPLQPDLVLVYIQTLSAAGRGDEAEKLAMQMIEKDASVSAIYDALFLHHMKNKRVEDAEAVLKMKVQNNPKNADGYLQLAAHHYSQGKRNEMLASLNKLISNTKDFPNAHLLVGDFYLRIRDLQVARQHYQQGADKDDKDKAVYQKRMIETLVRQNKKDEASQILKQILEENPKDQEAIAIRASLSMMSGTQEELQSAINDLQSVVSDMPQNPVLRFNLGRAYLAKGNSQQARIQLEEAVKIRPDYLLARVALGEVMLNSGEYGKALQAANETLSYDPQNIPARLIRIKALIATKDLGQARQELTEISSQHPNFVEAKLQLGGLDLAEQKYKAAEEIFQSVYDSKKDPRAMMGLVETYTRQGQFERAEKMLAQEAAKAPERVEYRLALGSIAARSGDFQRAKAEYQQVLAKNPQAADVWMQMGEAQRRTGDFEGAKNSFNKAKELAPSSATPYLQLALMYDSNGQRDLAKPLYEQILRLDPNNAIALNNLAYIMAETGADLDQALTMAQQAQQQRPTDTDIADTLGWIYIKKNLSDSAIAVFRDLVSKQPDRATYRYHLAVALVQKGDMPAAKKELEVALTAKPSKYEEQKIKELMSKIG